MLKRILTLLLSVIVLLPIFSSCGSDGDGDGTSADTSAGVPPTSINIKDYKIVCKENAPAAVGSLCKAIQKAAGEIGVTLEATDDFIKGGTDGNVPGKEILVGDTNRKESDEVKEGLNICDYAIEVVGEKIVIQAGSDIAMKDAVDFFINDVIKTGKGELAGDYEKVSIFKGATAPVLKFGFENIKDGKIKSDDGSIEGTLLAANQTSGYTGSGIEMKAGNFNSGMLLAPGTVASKIEGRVGFTASALVMPYNNHGWTGRVMTLCGNDGKSFFEFTYTALGAYIRVAGANGAKYELEYRYNLKSRVVQNPHPPTGRTYTNDGVWQHMLVTVDFKNDTIKLFVNGEEKKPEKEVDIDFGFDTFPKQTATKQDGIGVDTVMDAAPAVGNLNFHGILDEVSIYGYVLNEKEILNEYAKHGDPITPSSTDDQALLDDIANKLGDGVAILADSANIVHNKRVNKADVNDYSIKNIMLDGKLMIAANLCERLSGVVGEKALTINGKTVNGTTKDGKVYFSATEVCDALGWKYIDKVSENGMFIMLAPNSTLKADDDAHINRLVPLCTVGENEPKINAEQTRSIVMNGREHDLPVLYNPSIVRVGNDLFAIAEGGGGILGGSKGEGGTIFLRSQDNGKTWEKRGRIADMWYAVLFEHKGDLYVLGVYLPGASLGGSKDGKNVYYGVSRSRDGGMTWTEINDKQGGIVIPGNEKYDTDAPYHGSSNPVLKYKGKLYAAREIFGQKAFVLMADENSDILDPKNWTISGTYSNRKLNPNESSAVIGPDGNVWVISRTDEFGINKAFLMRLDDNNNLMPYTGNAETSTITIPTTASKFTCRYDENTGYYYALTSPSVTDDYYMQRNYLALVVSKDLVNWEICEMVLCDRELYNEVVSISQHAFQYVDWIFDGDDILLTVREAAEDAISWHEGHMITFYRIENYADLVKK